MASLPVTLNHDRRVKTRIPPPPPIHYWPEEKDQLLRVASESIASVFPARNTGPGIERGRL